MKNIRTAKAIRLERANTVTIRLLQTLLLRSTVDRQPFGFCTPSSRCKSPNLDLTFQSMGESEDVVMIVRCDVCGGSFRLVR